FFALSSRRRRIDYARLTIKFRIEMQPLRALLLLVVISTMLFHLADSDAASDQLANADKESKRLGAAGESGFNDASAGASNEFEKGKNATDEKLKCMEQNKWELWKCPAASISNLLSMALVVALGLFTRQ
ncbi:hypothetical protein PENTCL1PPCAC_4589, partial [Pristionchus entomophagus]